jgi:hypothetical protein
MVAAFVFYSSVELSVDENYCVFLGGKVTQFASRSALFG